MKLTIIKNFTFIFFILVLTSCSITHEVTVPSTIPTEMQQLIKSAKTEEVGYFFIPNDNATQLRFKTSIGATTRIDELNLNGTFKPLVDELIQTKFSKISNDDENTVKVIINKVDSNLDEPLFLSMEVNVVVNHLGKQDEKTISYSVNLNNSEKDLSIYNWLMKYVIGIDKFLDNIFEVQ